jgi:hypothetical protein
VGNRTGEGQAYGNLGNAYVSLGDYSKPMEYHAEHLTIANEVDDWAGEGMTYGNIGNAYVSLGTIPSQGASLQPDESEGCSPVSGGRIIRLCASWPSDDPPTPLRSSVDTGAEDRGGAPAEFAVVAGTVGCREDVGAVVLR